MAWLTGRSPSVSIRPVAFTCQCKKSLYRSAATARDNVYSYLMQRTHTRAMSKFSAHIHLPTILVVVAVCAALSAALLASSAAGAADAATAPTMAYGDPASACAGSGGKYLGDMKCQMADGSITSILFGADATRARSSASPVTPKSPHAWALATTAITFEFNGDRHDLLTGDRSHAGRSETRKGCAIEVVECQQSR